jgi:hypothetical protein
MNYGNIRVLSKSDKIEQNEIKIIIDRTNPVFGNPFVLKNKNNMQERLKVIDLYEQKFYEEINKNNSVVNNEIEKIVNKIKSGENIALICHCHPLPCHGDIISEYVKSIIYPNYIKRKKTGLF